MATSDSCLNDFQLPVSTTWHLIFFWPCIQCFKQAPQAVCRRSCMRAHTQLCLHLANRLGYGLALTLKLGHAASHHLHPLVLGQTVFYLCHPIQHLTAWAAAQRQYWVLTSQADRAQDKASWADFKAETLPVWALGNRQCST